MDDRRELCGGLAFGNIAHIARPPGQCFRYRRDHLLETCVNKCDGMFIFSVHIAKAIIYVIYPILVPIASLENEREINKVSVFGFKVALQRIRQLIIVCATLNIWALSIWWSIIVASCWEVKHLLNYALHQRDNSAYLPIGYWQKAQKEMPKSEAYLFSASMTALATISLHIWVLLIQRDLDSSFAILVVYANLL